MKDTIKQDALFKATVKLVHEIGFASSSVAKIAKEAGISPATLYIYYENKEDLLISTYIDIKKDLIKATLHGFDENMPIRDIFRQVWFNLFEFISKNPLDFYFTEQFANSPYADLIDKKKVNDMMAPVMKIMQRGIEQKIIKNVSSEILFAFMVSPIMVLANSRVTENFKKSEQEIETAFTLAWDAVKL